MLKFMLPNNNPEECTFTVNSIQQFQTEGVKRLTDIFTKCISDAST